MLPGTLLGENLLVDSMRVERSMNDSPTGKTPMQETEGEVASLLV